MEKTKGISILKTRNSEFERYRSNTKSLFVRTHGGVLLWTAQHESAKELEKRAIRYARAVGCDIDFELRTGHGIRVEHGSIYQS